MAQQYGSVKCDVITFTSGTAGNETDVSITVSGLANIEESGITITGNIKGDNITATGDLNVSGTGLVVSGVTIGGSLTVSGSGSTYASGLEVNGTFTAETLIVSGNATVTGNITTTGGTISGAAGQFTTLTGGTAGFTTVTGTTVTGTTANFVTVSGTTVTGDAAEFTSITGGTAGFTTVTGATVTGTTANFVTVSGTTVTGNTGNFTTATVTSGVFASGTEAAPSVSIGTTDNGLYSPGTDEVALATNGTGRLFIDSSGNVGIGVAAPSEKLDINVSSTLGFSIGDDPADSTKLALRSYQGSTSNNVRSITYIGAAHRFQVGAVTGTTASEVVRIDAEGRVGIGTQSPLYSLHSSNNSGNQFVAITSSTTADAGLLFGDSSSATRGQVRYENANDSMHFRTNGSEAMRIDSSGNVGIGTTAPSQELSVNGNAILLANGELLFADGTNQQTASIKNGASSNTSQLQFFTSSTERMRIDSSGRVGIGTTAVDTTLHIQGANTSGRGQLYIQSTATNVYPRFVLSDSADTMYLDVYGDTSNSEVVRNIISGGSHVWQVGSSEKARLDSSGRLLVGTSTARSLNSDIQLLQVEAADGSGTGRIAIGTNNNDNATGAGIYLFRSRAGSLNGNTIVNDGDDLGSIYFHGADGNDMDSRAAQIRCEVDGTPGSNDMPGRLVFSTTADGASSPTQRLRISQNGATALFGSSSAFYSGVTAGAGTAFATYVGRYSATSTDNGTISFYVWSNGNVQNTNNSYTGISDLKLKENIVNANSQWDDLKAFQIRNYNFKEGQTHTQIGLIAQEVELVSPGLVSESPDRDEEGNDLGTTTKSVNYSVLYMKAVKALQEAMDRIETLEAKVAALEAQ